MGECIIAPMSRMSTIVVIAALVGCVDAPASRQLAVTVQDAEEIECTAVTNSDALEQETLDAIAKDVERLWEDEREREPPTREGRIMHLNETQTEMHAWFDPHPGSDFAIDSEAYDSPFAVYVGEHQEEDFIEARYIDVFNTDDQDEDAGREQCGDRVRVQGTLSLTDAKGILGRIRWSHHIWVDSVTSACAGRIDCVRDIEVDGLEVE